MRKYFHRGYRIATTNLSVSRVIAYSALIVSLILLGNIVTIATVGYESIWTPIFMVIQTCYLGIAFILLSEFRRLDPVLEKMRIR